MDGVSVIVMRFKVGCSACGLWLSMNGPVPQGHPDVVECLSEESAGEFARSVGWYAVHTLSVCPRCRVKANGCGNTGQHVASLSSRRLTQWSEVQLCSECRGWPVWVPLDGRTP